MRTRLTLADLRIRLSVRLAVAPRQWFKRLWEPKARPHERDATREELVAFITHGWDCLEIDATALEISNPCDPSSRPALDVGSQE